MTAEQLDLWTEPVISRREDGIGRVITTVGHGWRARWTGQRYGWQFDRAITWTVPERGLRAGWEPWEPALPYGVDHVTDRGEAVRVLLDLADRLGDDPDWLWAHRRGRASKSA